MVGREPAGAALGGSLDLAVGDPTLTYLGGPELQGTEAEDLMLRVGGAPAWQQAL